MKRYVLITPAKNEEKAIEKTIKAVISQTSQVYEWVIVSDGSIDKTDDIIKKYAEKYEFIKFIRNDSKPEKNFSSKVMAFNKGLSTLSVDNYDYIGNLDGDVWFSDDYYQKMISYLEHDPKLGLVGGKIHEVFEGRVRCVRNSRISVAGAVQLFRRECFEAIGGYIPLKVGGIDSAAEICARAKGWKVNNFPEKVFHHGRVLTGKKNAFQALFQMGYSHYLLGYHPIFHLASCTVRLVKPPYLFGAVCFFAGFLKGVLKKEKKFLPPDIVNYLRNEQIERLLATISLQKKCESKEVNNCMEVVPQNASCND